MYEAKIRFIITLVLFKLKINFYFLETTVINIVLEIMNYFLIHIYKLDDKCVLINLLFLYMKLLLSKSSLTIYLEFTLGKKYFRNLFMGSKIYHKTIIYLYNFNSGYA